MNRREAPDIDIDFCKERRGEVIDYVKQKYGADNVAQIGTFGTLAARVGEWRRLVVGAREEMQAEAPELFA